MSAYVDNNIIHLSIIFLNFVPNTKNLFSLSISLSPHIHISVCLFFHSCPLYPHFFKPPNHKGGGDSVAFAYCEN